MEEDVEKESVTIQVPKAVMDFLRAVEKDPIRYLQHTIVDAFKADLECDDHWNYVAIFERYNLGPVFKAAHVPYLEPKAAENPSSPLFSVQAEVG